MITIPLRATYRLQFGPDLTFSDAERLLPYLRELGISHVYASPFLKARGGGQGYAVIDHRSLAPELGGEEGLRLFCATLQKEGMGLIVDLIPNHMAVFGDDNPWWLDVLEHGPASEYAGYFDIDWQPVSRFLRGRLLLPMLGASYGDILDRGEILLTFDPEKGSLAALYHENLLPLDPRTYSLVLEPVPAMLPAAGAGDASMLGELREVCEFFRALPRRRTTTLARSRQRRQRAREGKERLVRLWQVPAFRQGLEATLALFNGGGAGGKDFRRLHHLLEKQAFRLAYWRVAADDINYRRFFNLNHLAALRMEKPEVFAATHDYLRELTAAGLIQGIRIDHIDGLHDPAAYLGKLVREFKLPAGKVYVVVEKILAAGERLPENWPVAGTTGYEFANLVVRLLGAPTAEGVLTRLYQRITGDRRDLADLVHDCKKLIIRDHLSSELTVLAKLLRELAESDPHTRDFTLNGLREALSELVTAFDIYRTYRNPAEDPTAPDLEQIEGAVLRATRRNPGTGGEIFAFIGGVLGGKGKSAGQALRFTMKFQQYTAPIMAKAVEDTLFYRYPRLLSLNEVGGDPERFAVTPAEFHRINRARLEEQPFTMLATSTHDTKRSEEVRARLQVLSELPGEWRRAVLEWGRLNRRFRRLVDDRPAPNRSDEYLLYQTLLGSWPLTPLDPPGLATYRARIDAFMLKSVREAKRESSWLNPAQGYETALASFVGALLSPGPENRFLAAFLPFQKRVAFFGLLNSLSQTLLKLTIPGVPDTYQGQELWRFSLVDPDNRRPVDFSRRQGALFELADRCSGGAAKAVLCKELLENIEDGRAKLYIIWRTLNFRREEPELFGGGDYLPLRIKGAAAENLVSFARRRGDTTALVLVPRFYTRLLDGKEALADLGRSARWGDTGVVLPPFLQGRTYRNIFTGETIEVPDAAGEYLPVAEALGGFPVALLAPSG